MQDFFGWWTVGANWSCTRIFLEKNLLYANFQKYFVSTRTRGLVLKLYLT